jgi:hypothetical protein
MMAQPRRIGCPELLSLYGLLDAFADDQVKLPELCCHALAFCDMEATPPIRYFLALGAVWNINWSYCSGTDT